MRMTRERGQTGARRDVEAAYQRVAGEYKPYHEIAAGLFDTHGTAALVQAEIESRYGRKISEKTANDWINRGLAARRELV